MPVFHYETEYDVDILGFADARQPDSDVVRSWEAEMYPGGAEDYVAAFNAAVDDAVDSGVWLEPEAERFREAAGLIRFG